MSKTKYLISIAIGPVQDFIASARRSRDLWFGSHLLSELSKVVAKEIGKDNLIFPAITDDSQLDEKWEFNVVNKILAIIEKPDVDFDKTLRDIIKDRLKSIYEDKFKEIQTNLRRNGFPENYFKEDIAIAQINDLVEFYWAAVPYDENKDDYKDCRERVEILLSARKVTRDFNQLTPINSAKENAWASNAPKSSLDGQRESVIEDKAFDNENDYKKIQKIFHLRNKERLCGVGVLKRLAEQGLADKFRSTSHLASLPFRKGVGEAEFKKFADEINTIVERDSGFNRTDGQVIYKERLKDFISEENIGDAKQKLADFLKGKTPSPYFALLQADGDRIGTVIDNQDNPTKHRDLSEALSKFADTDVKRIVQDHNGCLIYSGGDDVLAMLPLHTVLDCTRDLADEFAKQLNGFSDKDGNKPTLSAGIAIVHHTEPLQESLETMRRAEKEAKSVKGKNALAIILSKRSGADTTIKGSWADDRKTGKSFDERLKRFIYLHLADALPDGVAYEIRDLWIRFQDDTGRVSTHFEEMIKAETLRILKRKKSESGTKEIDKKVFNYLEDLIKKISFYEKDKWTLEDLANEIIVARDFKRAYKQAGVKPEQFAKDNKLEELEK